MKKLKYYWNIFWLFRSMRLMLLADNRANFFFWSFISLAWSMVNLIFFSLLVGVNGELGGWNEAEVYVMVGVFTMIDGFFWMFMFGSMQEYTKSVFEGTLSRFLLKPADPQFILMSQYNTYNNLPRFALGVGLVVYYLSKLGVPFSPISVIGFIVAFISSILFLYFIWFTLATFSFWIDRLENINQILPSLQSLWRFPRNIYDGLPSLLIGTILPLTLIASVPAEIILGRSPWWWSLIMAALAVCAFAVSRAFLYASMKRFTSTGG